MSSISELLAYLRTHKVYWLGPALVLLLLGVLLLFSSGLIPPSFRYFEY